MLTICTPPQFLIIHNSHLDSSVKTIGDTIAIQVEFNDSSPQSTNLGFRMKWERIFEGGKTVAQSAMAWGVTKVSFSKNYNLASKMKHTKPRYDPNDLDMSLE